jgi:hypothetical protein
MASSAAQAAGSMSRSDAKNSPNSPPRRRRKRGEPTIRDRVVLKFTGWARAQSVGWAAPFSRFRPDRGRQQLSATCLRYRLDTLKGDRKGQCIRVNDQWRIRFEWPKGADALVKVRWASASCWKMCLGVLMAY